MPVGWYTGAAVVQDHLCRACASCQARCGLPVTLVPRRHRRSRDWRRPPPRTRQRSSAVPLVTLGHPCVSYRVVLNHVNTLGRL